MIKEEQKKVNWGIGDINKIINKLALICVYLHLLNTTFNNWIINFVSIVHGIFTQLDHMLVHKQLNKFQLIELILSMFSDQTWNKWEINKNNIYRKAVNIYKLNNSYE